MPSWASSVARSHCCSLSSCSVALATASASSPRRVARTDFTARGAFSAISRASLVASARRFSWSVSTSTRPSSRASSPPMRRPVSSISAAACWPMMRGRVTEMPKPWWMPSLTKLAPKRASGVATRKSGTSARPRPPPMAAPWMAPTTGLVLRNSRAASRYRIPVVFRKPSSVKSALPDSSSLPLPKFAPAQKCLPWAASTMARQSGFLSASANASAI